MKGKILAAVAVLVLSVTAVQGQVNFGIVAGPNFQNMVGKDAGGDKLTNGLITGFHAGVNISFEVAPDFLIQTGLLFSQKGSRNNESVILVKAANDDYICTTRVSYIELPVHILYRPELGSGHLLLGFGPYVAYGIGGTQNVDFEVLPAFEQKIKFRNEVPLADFLTLDYAYYKGFDAGADIFAGYELGMGLSVRLNAQLGLLDMVTDVANWEGESVLKNTGFSLSVGYNF